MNNSIYYIDSFVIMDKYRYLKDNLNGYIFYSYKTNNDIRIVKLLKKIGGKIVVSSIKEFNEVRKQIHLDNIIFHSVMSTKSEIEILYKNRPFCIVINNFQEFQKFNRLSKLLNESVNIGIRIDIEILFQNSRKPSINKFGMNISEAEESINIINKNSKIKLLMLAGHLGTNIISPKNYTKLLTYLSSIYNQVKYINIGGGFPSTLTMKKHNLTIDSYLTEIKSVKTDKIIIVEPGRYIVEDSCFIETTILGVFDNYIIVDISTNFLIPLDSANYIIKSDDIGKKYCILGRLCHNKDIIAQDVILSNPKVGDKLKILNCGAYTYSFRNNMGYDDPQSILI